jgi:hypothetical protein
LILPGPFVQTITCNNNLLTTLDVPKNLRLSTLTCNNNLITSLDLSQNTGLVYLTLNDNLLTSISVPPLTYGEINLNFNQLSASSINSFFTELGIATDPDPLNRDIYVTNNPGSSTCTPSIAEAKEWFVVAEPDIANLTTETGGTFSSSILSSTGYVGVIWWDSPTPQIFGDGDSGNEIIISKFNGGISRNVTFYSCNASGTRTGSMSSIDVSDQAVTDLNVSECLGLEILFCSQNSLTTLDLSDLVLLGEANADSMTEPFSINLTGCYRLSDLYVGYNQITSIDLSSCPSLTYLNCAYSSLTSLNLLDNPLLTDLDFSGMSLTSIDLSGNPSLYNLTGTNNLLTSLDLSSNIELIYCYINGNSLTSVNLSGCSALDTLLINGNNLTTIDLSDCILLRNLQIQQNLLTSLDLSGLTTLAALECYDNQITTLNISDANFPDFQYLIGRNNPMTALVATGASSGRMQIQSCLLNSSGLNSLFTSLGNVDPTADYSTLFIYGNPGTATCTPSIATGKGWTVDTTTQQ